MYLNVLGYSGTNSKYVDIRDNDVLQQRRRRRAEHARLGAVPADGDGKIRNNNIFWNNFDYFLPNSPVKTVSGGLGHIGDADDQLPDRGRRGPLRRRRLDGLEQPDLRQLHVGRRRVLGPVQRRRAVNENNQFIDNQMGRNGTDTNGYDFFNDGSGKGNCFSGNSTRPSTRRRRRRRRSCSTPPARRTPSAPGTTRAIPARFNNLADYVTSDPPCTQQDSWSKHPHPAFKNEKPVDVKQDNGDYGQCQ